MIEATNHNYKKQQQQQQQIKETRHRNVRYCIVYSSLHLFCDKTG